MMSMYNIVRILLDIPLGVLADSLGKKKNLLLGTAFKVGYYLIITFSRNVLFIWLAYLMIGIADTELTNSKVTYLHDLIGSQEGGNYTKVYGNSLAISSCMNILLNLTGGILYDIDNRIPFILIIIMLIASGLVAVTLKSDSIKEDKKRMNRSVIVMEEGYKEVRNSRELRTVMTSSVVSAVFLVSLITLKQPYMTHIGMTGKQVGVVGALLQIGSVIAGSYSSKILNLTKDYTYIFILIALMLTGTLLRETTTMWGVLLYSITPFISTIKSVSVRCKF